MARPKTKYEKSRRPIDQAIVAAGGPTALARAMGVNHGTVVKWSKSGRIPIEHVLPIEELTRVPRWRLRPDVYPPEEYGGEQCQ